MEELRLKLIKEINNSNLSVEAAMFVVKDVYRDIIEAYHAYKQSQTLNDFEGEEKEN